MFTMTKLNYAKAASNVPIQLKAQQKCELFRIEYAHTHAHTHINMNQISYYTYPITRQISKSNA